MGKWLRFNSYEKYSVKRVSLYLVLGFWNQVSVVMAFLEVIAVE